MMKQSRSLALLWLAVPWLVWGRGLEASTSTTALAPWVTEFASDVEAVRRALVVLVSRLATSLGTFLAKPVASKAPVVSKSFEATT